MKKILLILSVLLFLGFVNTVQAQEGNAPICVAAVFFDGFATEPDDLVVVIAKTTELYKIEIFGGLHLIGIFVANGAVAGARSLAQFFGSAAYSLTPYGPDEQDLHIGDLDVGQGPMEGVRHVIFRNGPPRPNSILPVPDKLAFTVINTEGSGILYSLPQNFIPNFDEVELRAMDLNGSEVDICHLEQE